MPIDLNRQRKTYSYTRVQPRYQEAQIIIDETLDWKNSVRAASTGAHTLTGATPLTVGGVSLANEDRVLLKNQSSASQNGIYYYVVSGGNYTLERASDVSQETISCGAATYVEEGTNGGKIYILSTPNPITVDSTSLAWTEFSGGGGGGGGGNDYWVSTTDGAIYTTGSVAIRGGLGSVDASTDIGADVFFFVSGSITGIGSDDKKSVFGGDVVMSGSLEVSGDQVEITGSLSVTNGITGSLTRLTDGTAYILAGPNITINTGSNGAVQITGSAGGITGTGTSGYLSAWTSSTSLGDSHIYYWTGAPSITTYRYKAYNNQFVSLNDSVQLVLETDNTTGARVGINSSVPQYPLDVSEGIAGTSTIANFRNNDVSGGTDRGIQMYMGAGNFNPGTFRLLHEWKTDRHYTRFRTTNLSSLSISGPVEDLLVLSSDRKVLVTGSLSVRYDGSSQVGTVVDVQKLDGNQIMWISSSAGSNPVGSDVFMWVSGSRTDNNTGADKVVFGGDVRVSGSLTIGTGSVFLTSNDIQFGSSGIRIQKNGNDMKFFDLNNTGGKTLTELAAASEGLGGSGTANYVAKFTGTSTLGVSTIFDNGTNVGIGTSSMTKKLVVHGGDALINGLTIGKGNSGNISNTALGVGALSVSSGDQYNTAVGYFALSSNTAGQGNVAVGDGSLSLNTTSNHNTAVGSSALLQGGGGSNVAIGYYSQFSNTDGSSNSSVGRSSLTGITTGAGNVAVGAFAGSYDISGRSRTTTGNNNIFIGANASAKNSGDSNSIAIGYFALGLGSNTTVIGNGSTTLTSIPAGNFGIGSTNPDRLLVISGSGASLGIYNSAASAGSMSIDAPVAGGYAQIDVQGSFDLRLNTNNAEAMRINASQNVGINTNNPSEKLHVNSGNVKVDTAGYGVMLPTSPSNAGTNTLDCYYEQDLTGCTFDKKSGTINYTSNTLKLTRIGRLVTITGEIVVGTVSGPPTGALRIVLNGLNSSDFTTQRIPGSVFLKGWNGWATDFDYVPYLFAYQESGTCFLEIGTWNNLDGNTDGFSTLEWLSSGCKTGVSITYTV